MSPLQRDEPVELIDLRFSLESHGHIAAGEPCDSAVQWQATLRSVGDHDEPVVLATAELWTVEDGAFPTTYVLDDVDAALAKYIDFFNGDELNRELDLAGLGDGLVIANRLLVPHGQRGRGFGPLLLAESLHVLSKGRALVGCEPAPFELKPDEPEWLLEQDRLIRLGREFGFVEWQAGLWYLDPATTTLDETRAQLRARFA